MHFENSTKKKREKEQRRKEERGYAERPLRKTVDSSAARRATYFVQIKR